MEQSVIDAILNSSGMVSQKEGNRHALAANSPQTRNDAAIQGRSCHDRATIPYCLTDQSVNHMRGIRQADNSGEVRSKVVNSGQIPAGRVADGCLYA